MDLEKIDALVAEHIMGYEGVCSSNYSYMGDKEAINLANPKGYSYYSHYSTDIAAAWEVVERMRLTGCRLWACDEKYNDKRIIVNFRYPMDREFEGRGEFPFAVCLAALKAKGIDYNRIIEG